MSWHGRLGCDGKGWLGSRGEDRLGAELEPGPGQLVKQPCNRRLGRGRRGLGCGTVVSCIDFWKLS